MVPIGLVLLAMAVIGELGGATVEAPTVRTQGSDTVAMERQGLAQSVLEPEGLEHELFHVVSF